MNFVSNQNVEQQLNDVIVLQSEVTDYLQFCTRRLFSVFHSVRSVRQHQAEKGIYIQIKFSSPTKAKVRQVTP